MAAIVVHLVETILIGKGEEEGEGEGEGAHISFN